MTIVSALQLIVVSISGDIAYNMDSVSLTVAHVYFAKLKVLLKFLSQLYHL